MFNLTTTRIGQEELNAVNTRELHQHLEVGTQYSTWIKKQLEDFEENEDFTIFISEYSRGQAIVDYIVTLDVAKHICMLSRTAKGKETRKYFIEVEKQANKPISEEEAYRIASTNYIAKLEKEKLQLTAKAEVLISMESNKTVWTMMEWADLLSNSLHTKIGRNKLLKALRALGYIQKAEESKTLPYRNYIDALFVVKTDIKGYPYSCVTSKGIELITPKLEAII